MAISLLNMVSHIVVWSNPCTGTGIDRACGLPCENKPVLKLSVTLFLASAKSRNFTSSTTSPTSTTHFRPNDSSIMADLNSKTEPSMAEGMEQDHNHDRAAHSLDHERELGNRIQALP
jgi:hypothetical protein